MVSYRVTRIVSLTLLVLVCTALYPGYRLAEAAPGFTPTEYLTPSFSYQCDFSASKPNINLASAYTMADGNPGACTDAFWETNDTYLYWGNATSALDTDANWGVGRAIFGLDNPVGTSDYWQVSATYWAAGITFIDPGWVQIGTYVLSTSDGRYSGGNIGIGILDDDGNLIYEQMHSSAYEEGYWHVQGDGQVDNPPDSFNRPETGIEWYDLGENDLWERPWTLAEVRNMVIIVELRIQTTIFSNIQYIDSGSAIALALAGCMLAIAPVSYTPDATPTGSFILRPDNDWTSVGWYIGATAYTSPLWSQVDDTNNSGDGVYTFIRSMVDVSGHTALFTLTDPPDWAADTQYTVRLWVIMKASAYLTEGDCNLTLGPGAIGQGLPPIRATTVGAYNIPTTWKNYTAVVPKNPVTGSAWTLADLDSMLAVISTNVVVPDTEYIYVTQIGALCTPIAVADGDEGDDGGPMTFDDVSGFLYGGGVRTIFALMGVGLMVLAPTIGVLKANSGEGGMMGFFVAMLLFVFGTAFFWVGLMGSWSASIISLW